MRVGGEATRHRTRTITERVGNLGVGSDVVVDAHLEGHGASLARLDAVDERPDATRGPVVGAAGTTDAGVRLGVTDTRDEDASEQSHAARLIDLGAPGDVIPGRVVDDELDDVASMGGLEATTHVVPVLDGAGVGLADGGVVDRVSVDGVQREGGLPYGGRSLGGLGRLRRIRRRLGSLGLRRLVSAGRASRVGHDDGARDERGRLVNGVVDGKTGDGLVAVVTPRDGVGNLLAVGHVGTSVGGLLDVEAVDRIHDRNVARVALDVASARDVSHDVTDSEVRADAGSDGDVLGLAVGEGRHGPRNGARGLVKGRVLGRDSRVLDIGNRARQRVGHDHVGGVAIAVVGDSHVVGDNLARAHAVGASGLDEADVGDALEAVAHDVGRGGKGASDHALGGAERGGVVDAVTDAGGDAHAERDVTGRASLDATEVPADAAVTQLAAIADVVDLEAIGVGRASKLGASRHGVIDADLLDRVRAVIGDVHGISNVVADVDGRGHRHVGREVRLDGAVGTSAVDGVASDVGVEDGLAANLALGGHRVLAGEVRLVDDDRRCSRKRSQSDSHATSRTRLDVRDAPLDVAVTVHAALRGGNELEASRHGVADAQAADLVVGGGGVGERVGDGTASTNLLASRNRRGLGHVNDGARGRDRVVTGVVVGDGAEVLDVGVEAVDGDVTLDERLAHVGGAAELGEHVVVERQSRTRVGDSEVASVLGTKEPVAVVEAKACSRRVDGTSLGVVGRIRRIGVMRVHAPLGRSGGQRGRIGHVRRGVEHAVLVGHEDVLLARGLGLERERDVLHGLHVVAVDLREADVLTDDVIGAGEVVNLVGRVRHNDRRPLGRGDIAARSLELANGVGAVLEASERHLAVLVGAGLADLLANINNVAVVSNGRLAGVVDGEEATLEGRGAASLGLARLGVDLLHVDGDVADGLVLDGVGRDLTSVGDGERYLVGRVQGVALGRALLDDVIVTDRETRQRGIAVLVSDDGGNEATRANHMHGLAVHISRVDVVGHVQVAAVGSLGVVNDHGLGRASQAVGRASVVNAQSSTRERAVTRSPSLKVRITLGHVRGATNHRVVAVGDDEVVEVVARNLDVGEPRLELVAVGSRDLLDAVPASGQRVHEGLGTTVIASDDGRDETARCDHAVLVGLVAVGRGRHDAVTVVRVEVVEHADGVVVAVVNLIGRASQRGRALSRGRTQVVVTLDSLDTRAEGRVVAGGAGRVGTRTRGLDRRRVGLAVERDNLVVLGDGELVSLVHPTPRRLAHEGGEVAKGRRGRVDEGVGRQAIARRRLGLAHGVATERQRTSGRIGDVATRGRVVVRANRPALARLVRVVVTVVVLIDDGLGTTVRDGELTSRRIGVHAEVVVATPRGTTLGLVQPRLGVVLVDDEATSGHLLAYGPASVICKRRCRGNAHASYGSSHSEACNNPTQQL